MPFEPGKSGNPLGPPKKEKSFANMLRIAISEASKDGTGTKLRKVAEKLVDVALEGDVSAIKEIADRLDGKVAQAITGGDENDAPLQVQLIRMVAPLTND